MEYLVSEFDKRRFSHFYTLRVDENSAILFRGCMERAAETLAIEMQYAFKYIASRDTDHVIAEFAFGVALSEESHYRSLMEETDRLFNEARSNSLKQFADYDAVDAHCLAEYTAQMFGLSEPERKHEIDLELD